MTASPEHWAARAEFIRCSQILKVSIRSKGSSCKYQYYSLVLLTSGWWRGTVVERRSLAGELSLSCA